MVLHELACLPDHFIDESCGALGIAVSSQQREACRLHSFVGITPRRRANVVALSKAGCNEHLQRVLDLVIVPSDQRVLATDVSQPSFVDITACPAS